MVLGNNLNHFMKPYHYFAQFLESIYDYKMLFFAFHYDKYQLNLF